MAELLPVPPIGSTNWSPWAQALQDVVVEQGAAITTKAPLTHIHEGGGTDGGSAGGMDGGTAGSIFTDTADGGGAA